MNNKHHNQPPLLDYGHKKRAFAPVPLVEYVNIENAAKPVGASLLAIPASHSPPPSLAIERRPAAPTRDCAAHAIVARLEGLFAAMRRPDKPGSHKGSRAIKMAFTSSVQHSCSLDARPAARHPPRDYFADSSCSIRTTCCGNGISIPTAFRRSRASSLNRNNTSP